MIFSCRDEMFVNLFCTSLCLVFVCAIVLFDPVVIDVFVDLLFIVCCQTNRLEMMKCHKFIDVGGGANVANNSFAMP